MQELEWPLGNNKKISEVLYKIEHNSLPGVVVHGDNFIIQREKKINWFNGGFQEKICIHNYQIQSFLKKNTDNQDREEREDTEPGSTSDTESESGAELRSRKDAELRSGKDAELRSGTKSAIIIERDLEGSIKTRKTERLHRKLKDGRSGVSYMQTLRKNLGEREEPETT